MSSHWPGDQSEEYIKRENGGIHISAKALRIVWGNDSRFWQWAKISGQDSCFEIGAELIQVNWLEVTGCLDLQKFPLEPLKEYEIKYVVKFMDDAFGWHAAPITFQVCSIGITCEGKKTMSREAETVLLEHYLKDQKKSSWNEIHGGEFSFSSASDYLMGKIEFGMKEVKTEWWKGGIVLEGVKITPKHLLHIA